MLQTSPTSGLKLPCGLSLGELGSRRHRISAVSRRCDPLTYSSTMANSPQEIEKEAGLQVLVSYISLTAPPLSLRMCY